MVELRFVAEKPNGQEIAGTLTAESFGAGKKKIKQQVAQNKLKLKRIDRRDTYQYKIKKGNDKPIKGEQKAYSKKEVIDLFERLGYEVLNVEKNIITFGAKPSPNDIMMFVKISADMLEQNLSFGEILTFLINDTQNKVLRETLKQISNDLRRGVDSEKAFLKHQAVFGRFTAYMLGLASKSGNMKEIYRSTAKFLERSLEFKKNVKSALVSPMVTVLAMFLAVLYYVGYIFPETARLFTNFDMQLPPMTAFTLALSDFLTNNLLLIFILMFGPIIALWFYFTTDKGKVVRDRLLLKLPKVGDLIHKSVIEVFCRTFYAIYAGSQESITPIKISAEATGNHYFEKQVKEKTLKLMVRQGVGISDGLKASEVFTETALSRIRSGEETGNIKNSMLQLANYYESDSVYRFKNFIEFIQMLIAAYIFIVMILLTLVSAETATITPKRPGVGMMVMNFIQNLF